MKTEKEKNTIPDRNLYPADYAQLKQKMFFQFFILPIFSILLIGILLQLYRAGKVVYFVIWLYQRIFNLSYEEALYRYADTFRANIVFILVVVFLFAFNIMTFIVIRRFIKYFDIVNQGIGGLLEGDADISLPSELLPMERRLNAIKQALRQSSLDAKLAEQRKNDLVVYLAHDIRTPLTSVIGYLNFLEEVPDMPREQRANYVRITLNKAYHLEKMVNEFFEITRYDLQQITLHKETIDLYYMLVQLTDELSPVLSANGNRAVINAPESLKIYGDPDKLARVFNNILKNAAAYSCRDSEIVISAAQKDGVTEISFQNNGNTIPQEKLSAIFEKFYRLDAARSSHTGGTGLGLAIAKEIMAAHGGTIAARSEDNTITFTITLPHTTS